MPGSAYSIGIDIGGTKIFAVAEDSEGTRLADIRVESEHRDPETLVTKLEGAIVALQESVGATSALAAIGIGIAGLVRNDGVFIRGPHLPGIENLDLTAALKQRDVSIPIYIDNDANVAAWAEHRRGAGRDHTEMVLITFGTGIGAGIILNGRIFNGRHGFAGEFGHVVIEQNGVLCECGRRGCWEQYASGNALGRLGTEARANATESTLLAETVRGEDVIAAARQGDVVALRVLDTYASYCAIGIADVANMLDNDVVVLGGGVMDASDLLLPRIHTAYEAIPYRGNVKIVKAELGSAANAIGAADLAMRLSLGAPDVDFPI